MKNISFKWLAMVAVALFQVAFQWSAGISDTGKVKTSWQAHIKNLRTDLQEFLQLCEEGGNTRQLLHAFEKSRGTFKKAEAFIAYYDDTFYNQLNGPNLLKPDRNTSAYLAVEPEGFQVIEALLAAEAPDHGRLAGYLRQMLATVDRIIIASGAYPFHDREIFEAMQQEVVRITALGITGFDSPVLRHSLHENKTALLEVSTVIALYMGEDATAAHKASVREIAVLAMKGEEQLSRVSFNDFDRLTFIAEVVNPLYAALVKLQRAMNIETWELATGTTAAINSSATNIFDKDFLNVYYFSKDRRNYYRPEVAALGRLLFFDPVLSVNNQRSCGSCHIPSKGFCDGLELSPALGFNGTITRNTPTLLNAALQQDFFYDHRAASLEQQVDHVILNEKEFGETYTHLLEKLRSSGEYRQSFSRAFPAYPENDAIHIKTLQLALAAYMRTLVSFNSPFDRFVRGETTELPADARAGFNLFMGKAMCGTCHFAPSFNGTIPPKYRDTESEVLGITTRFDTINPNVDTDPGRYQETRSDLYRNAFKTPTVRNAALTAPYMHHGQFATLEEVVQFYNHGGGAGLGLEVPNQTLPPERLDLSTVEVKQIVVFMESLTDNPFASDGVARLPAFPDKAVNTRKPGGVY